MLIDNIPNILQYVVPGVICVIIFTYFASIDVSMEVKLVTSCVISFLLLAIVSILKNLFLSKYIGNNVLIDILIASIIGIMLSILSCYIYVDKKFSRLTYHLFHKTPHKSIWRDAIDLKKGASVKAYIKDCDYFIVGVIKYMEENGEESWFAISRFTKYDRDTNKPLDNEPSFTDDYGALFLLRLSDIEHIEIFN